MTMTARSFIFIAAAIGVLPSWGQLPLSIYEDVPTNAAYYDHVNLMRLRLIDNGCSASPQNYCPYNYLTRGQAATLIIRSLFSGIAGDPDLFSVPGSQLFNDVPPTHPQYRYIQKMKELGITDGCTANQYCPDRVVSYGELAVFAYRARRKSLVNDANAYVPPPPACEYYIFDDVPANHLFCAYIHATYDAVGANAITPQCPSGNFCPDVTFNQYGQWATGQAVDRRTVTFYLVTGILDADHPQMLPTSNGQLEAVSSEGGPSDCQWSYPAMVNMVLLAGSQLYGYSYTTMSSFSDGNFWSFVVAPTLKENGTVRYSTHRANAGTYGAAQVSTPLLSFNPANNYEHPVGHEIASACLAGGRLSGTSLPYPTLLSANQTVLYRGMSQQVSFRGTSLQGAGAASARQAYLFHPGTSVGTLVSAAVSNVSQFGATLGFTTPTTTPAGEHLLSVIADYTPVLGTPGPALANGFQPVYVADPTPVLNPLSPASSQQGTVVSMTLSGAYFGASPRVCINGACANGGGTQVTSNGVTLSQGLCSACSTQIPITLTIASNATVGPYAISVRSQGAMGTGFQPAPQQQTQDISAAQNFEVQGAPPPTVRLQYLDFDTLGDGVSPGTPAHFVTSYRAMGGDYTSEANTLAPLNNRVYNDEMLSGNPTLAPAAFRLYNGQTTPLSRRPKLAYVILKVVGSSAPFSTTLRIESSNPKLQFPDAPISFENGEGRVQNLVSSTAFSAIDNYTTTLTFRLLSNPGTVITSFTLPVYVLYDVPRILPNYIPVPGLIYPSASQTVTDKRIALATMLASGATSAATAASSIVTNVSGQFDFGDGNISDYNFGAWALYHAATQSQDWIEIDCISHSLIAGAILNMMGVQTNIAFSFPTTDGDALSQEARFISGGYQYLRFYPPSLNVANDFEGYLETVVDDKAYTVVPVMLNIVTEHGGIIIETPPSNPRAFSVMYRMTSAPHSWEQWWTTGGTSRQANKVPSGQVGFPYP